MQDSSSGRTFFEVPRLRSALASGFGDRAQFNGLDAVDSLNLFMGVVKGSVDVCSRHVSTARIKPGSRAWIDTSVIRLNDYKQNSCGNSGVD